MAEAGLPYIPYCGEPAAPAALWSAWNGDPVLLTACLLAAILGVRRTRDGTALQRACFGGAWLVLFIALVSPLCNLTSALFGARVVQHLLMIQLAAPLLILSGAFAIPTRVLKLGPEVAWGVHGVLIWVWHLPGPYEAALRHDGLLWLMHLSLFLSALPAWHFLLQQERALRGRAMLAALGTSIHMGLLAAVLAFADHPFFRYHEFTSWLWGLSALEDQQLGALIMWVVGSAAYLVAGLVAMASLVSDRVATRTSKAHAPKF